MKPAVILLFWCAASALGQTSAGTFTDTGAMATPRSWHTATLLNNGQVLIAGGVTNSSFSATASAELYDPMRGTFSLTGPMTTPRAAQTAILLPDGKVLIAGGASRLGPGETYLTTTEVYDPSTATFTVASEMIHGHGCAQAHVLNNGKILLSGGSSVASPVLVPVPDAELYDPTTGFFAAAGIYATVPPQFISCSGRASSLLADGRVLIIWEDDLAEIYDPETGSFTQTGKPLRPSFNIGLATGTLLMDGRVLKAGGEAGSPPYRNAELAELFDVRSGSFTPAGAMSADHDAASATLLPDGTVLIAGGVLPIVDDSKAATDVYDPVSGIFRAGPEMLRSRSLHTATLLKDGRVLIAGGLLLSVGAYDTTPLAELYTPDVLTPAPVLLSLTGDAQGQGTVLHAGTARRVTASDPALPGEALEIYCTGLAEGSVIPPQVAIGGKLASVLYFGNAPKFPGLDQVNVRVPSGVTPGLTVTVRLNYLGRPSNEVTITVGQP